MKDVLKYLSVVLFVSLILTKASAFHVFEQHDHVNDQENHCELCLLVLNSQQADILTVSGDLTTTICTVDPVQAKITFFDLQVVFDLSKTDLFSRPPPSLL